ncbi:hypothetical protein [Acetilactobacillus jinshanensis]|nr:hypothetical protein [Acetilactobacillus jinshanensis]
MFSKKELKSLDKINPDEAFLDSKMGLKAMKEAYQDALDQPK